MATRLVRVKGYFRLAGIQSYKMHRSRPVDRAIVPTQLSRMTWPAVSQKSVCSQDHGRRQDHRQVTKLTRPMSINCPSATPLGS